MKTYAINSLSTLMSDLEDGTYLREQESFLLTDDEEIMLLSFLYTYSFLEYYYDGIVTIENNNFYVDEISHRHN